MLNMHLVRVFAKGQIPHIVTAILNRPVPTPERGKFVRRYISRCETCHRKGDRPRHLTRFQDHPFALAPQHLLHTKPVQKIIQVVRTGQGPGFQAPLPLVDRRYLPQGRLQASGGASKNQVNSSYSWR